MIAEIVDSCETCKLLDKTKYETNHGYCPIKGKRRYSNWTCCKYEPVEREKEGQ